MPRQMLLVGLILLVAIIFRLGFIDLIEFKLDEAVNVYEIQKFFKQPYLMQTGPIQSTGIYNPPLFFYVLTILALPSRDPIYLSFMIALINVLSLIGLYFVLRRFYGQLPAFIATILLAGSPWAILLSRKIWMPDLLMPLLVAYLYFLHRLIIDKNRSSSLGLFAVMLLLIQMHASGLFLTVATIATLALLRIRPNFKAAALGVFLGLIPALPYIVRQFTGDEFCPDCSAFVSFSDVAKSFDPLVFLRPLQFTGGAFWQIVLGHDWSDFSRQPLIQLINVLFDLTLVLPVAGFAWIVYAAKNKLFIVAIPVIVTLLYFITQTQPIVHYFIILSPFIALSVGLLWQHLVQSVHTPIAKKLIITSFGLIIAANLVFEGLFYQYLSQKQVIDGDFGPIYPHTKQLVDSTLRPYSNYPDFDDLQSNAYLYAAYPNFYANTGEYLAQNNHPAEAAELFQKAVAANPDDNASAANLIFIYIRTNRLTEAETALQALTLKDPTTAGQLRQLLSQAKVNQTKP